METVQRWRLAAILTFGMAVVFWACFQLSKGAAINAVSPFADDPYDAVGSVAIQVAGFAGLLSLARALRLRSDAAQGREKLRFIRNGNAAALLAVAATLATDIVAIAQHPAQRALAGAWLALLGGMAVVVLFAALAAVALVWALRGAALPQQRDAPSRGAELGEAIDDVMALALTPVRWLAGVVPAIETLQRGAGRLLAVALRPFHWLDPHRHPWRFAVAFAVVVGIGLAASHYVFEGPAPDLQRTVKVSLFFFGVEMAIVLGCYLVFGGVLGLRPPLLPTRRNGPASMTPEYTQT